jgi:hypothetical protein
MTPFKIRCACVALVCLDAALVCWEPAVALGLWMPAAMALVLAVEGEGIR